MSSETAEAGLDVRGFNQYGVLMCECKPYGPVHAYEPGEWCSPTHVLPASCPTQPDQKGKE